LEKILSMPVRFQWEFFLVNQEERSDGVGECPKKRDGTLFAEEDAKLGAAQSGQIEGRIARMRPNKIHVRGGVQERYLGLTVDLYPRSKRKTSIQYVSGGEGREKNREL